MSPSRVHPGAGRMPLEGNRLKVSQSRTLTDEGFHESPMLTTGADGTAWVCWLSREKNDQELVYAGRYVDGVWSSPMRVSANPGKYESPVIACLSDGRPVVAWVSIEESRWELTSSLWSGDEFGDPVAVPAGAGRAANPQMASGNDGALWLTWESYSEGRFRVMLNGFQNGQWGSPVDITDGRANAYDPAISVDPRSGRVWVAYSAVDNGVERAIFLTGYNPDSGAEPAIEMAVGGRLEGAPAINAYPAVLCDDAGRVWVAYQNDNPKSKRNHDTCWQGDQDVSVVCWDGDRLTRVRPGTSGYGGREVLTDREDLFPALVRDGAGRLLLFSRDVRGKEEYGEGQSLRCEYHFRAGALDGAKGWTPPEILLEDGQDELGALSRTAVTRADGNAVWIAWQDDNIRVGGQAYDVVGIDAPNVSNIRVARVEIPEEVAPLEEAVLVETAPGERRPVRATGINAPALRGRPAIPRRTIEAKGHTYTLLMGNLHEHSNIPNSCSRGTAADGTFFDNYRYGIDVQGYDFMALTDHDNGYYYEVAWRKNLRAADFYNQPPHFIAVPAYEFSFLDHWTWGRAFHPALGSQNLYFASREDAARFVDEQGVLYTMGHEETDNLVKLLAMLRKKGIKDAVLPPHQLTDYYSVTDWSIVDDEYRTVMEIFQTRGSYEYRGCPRQSTCNLVYGTEDEAAGSDTAWAQDALARGQRMGFFASSDHFATGVGTAALLVKEVSRHGIIEAMKARRCYATTGDKIFVDFRINGAIMGREIRCAARPRITARVEGTAPLREVALFKNNELAYEKKGEELGGQPCFDLDFIDHAFHEDSFYYLRVIQDNEEMAWASPIWVDRD